MIRRTRLLVVTLLWIFSNVANALPPLWEPSYNITELNATSGRASGGGGPSRNTNGQENAALGFSFPFGGANYTTVSVDSDGGLVLLNSNTVQDISNTIWSSNFQSEFNNLGGGTPSPIILPFNAALSQNASGGRVYFATFNNAFNGFVGNRAVITWENSALETSDPTPDISFQVQLLDDGTIIFGYDTKTSPTGTNWNNNSESGFVVGFSNGNGEWPLGSQNLSLAELEFGSGTTVYQIWCLDEDPANPPSCFQSGLDQNRDFDLDNFSVVFNPDGSDKYLISNTIKDATGIGGPGVCATAP